MGEEEEGKRKGKLGAERVERVRKEGNKMKGLRTIKLSEILVYLCR